MKAILKKDIKDFDLRKGQEVEVERCIVGGVDYTEILGYTITVDNPNWKPNAKEEDLEFID